MLMHTYSVSRAYERDGCKIRAKAVCVCAKRMFCTLTLLKPGCGLNLGADYASFQPDRGPKAGGCSGDRTAGSREKTSGDVHTLI